MSLTLGPIQSFSMNIRMPAGKFKADVNDQSSSELCLQLQQFEPDKSKIWSPVKMAYFWLLAGRFQIPYGTKGNYVKSMPLTVYS